MMNDVIRKYHGTRYHVCIIYLYWHFKIYLYPEKRREEGGWGTIFLLFCSVARTLRKITNKATASLLLKNFFNSDDQKINLHSQYKHVIFTIPQVKNDLTPEHWIWLRNLFRVNHQPFFKRSAAISQRSISKDQSLLNIDDNICFTMMKPRLHKYLPWSRLHLLEKLFVNSTLHDEIDNIYFSISLTNGVL